MIVMTFAISFPLAAFAGEKDLRKQPGVVAVEFIYTKAPFPQCHASTIEQTPAGLVAAWFGGTREGHRDVGIWLSRRVKGKWTAPVQVADGTGSKDAKGQPQRYPCWNPVLFQPKRGPLLLFYKVGPNPRAWWTLLMTSKDGGKTWSKPRRLPKGFLGPVRNRPIQLANGTILCGSSTEHDGWKVHFEWTADLGKTWRKTDPVKKSREFATIQPTLLTYPDGAIQALCRSRKEVITETWSRDGGKTWSAMAATKLPNPNSGIAAITLKDGRHLLVYNHTKRLALTPRGREMLNVAISKDGKNWRKVLDLENERFNEFSYPFVMQTSDGKVHITYTWKRRRIKHVVLDPEKLK